MIDWKIFSKKGLKLLAGIIVIILISGCAKFAHILTKEATVPELNFIYLSPETENFPDANLKNVFSVYWHKRFTGAPSEEIFTYEAPHFRKMVVYPKYDAYMKNLPKGDILRIEIASFIPATGHLYEIPVNIVFQGNDAKEQTMSLRDRWVMLDDGRWYHVLRDPLAFPKTG